MTDPFATGGTAPATGASPFGTTTQQQQPINGAANGAASLDQPSQHVPEPLPDINDPSLTSESLTAREGDAFASPPPPPDGIYRVKLKLRGVKVEDVGGADITQYLAGGDIAPWVPGVAKDRGGNVTGSFAKTIMDVQIADVRFPEYEGTFLQVPFKWMDTRTSQKGLSKIGTILSLAGKRPDGQPWIVTGQTYSQKTMMEIFLKFLAGEPEILARSEWSVSCDVCGQAAKAAGGSYPKSVDGMQKFPPLPGKPGQYSPDYWCPVNRAHGTTRARAMAVQYYALDHKHTK
jgi:hypothetical protein